RRGETQATRGHEPFDEATGHEQDRGTGRHLDRRPTLIAYRIDSAAMSGSHEGPSQAQTSCARNDDERQFEQSVRHDEAHESVTVAGVDRQSGDESDLKAVEHEADDAEHTRGHAS